MRERETEREGERDRERGRERQRETERDRERVVCMSVHVEKQPPEVFYKKRFS